jgi:microsomal dipeptidase-like Zn-dependent dipeptidase
MALAGLTVIPKFTLGRHISAALPKAERTFPARVIEAINDFGIVDLHCHPSLKMYLWGKKIWKRYHPSAGLNSFPLTYTVDELASGNVKGFLCSHYLVEADFLEKSPLLRILLPGLELRFPGLSDRIEHKDYSNFTQINVMIDTLETQVHRANKKQKRIEFVIARDFSEFDRALSQGKIPIAHAIEGAHALGTNFPMTQERNQPPAREDRVKDGREKADWYVRNLEALKARGVCLITIGHIFKNDIAFPVEGISPDAKHLLGMDPYKPEQHLPLTEIGKIVVEKMLDIGMIVDLTHSTLEARREVFDLNRKRVTEGKKIRPLTFTHTGAQHIFEKHEVCNHKTYDDFKLYDASDEEIDWICECDGTIGIIPENFWLIGCDAALNGKEYKNGIKYIVETIQYINSKTRKQNYDNISIGTDFDGFADAPHDLYKPSHLPVLIKALRENKISDENIKKITSENALRLLRYGWGNPKID